MHALKPQQPRRPITSISLCLQTRMTGQDGWSNYSVQLHKSSWLRKIRKMFRDMFFEEVFHALVLIELVAGLQYEPKLPIVYP